MASTRRVALFPAALLCAAAALVLAPPAQAQQGGSNPITESLQSTMKRYSGWLVQSAKDMPADKYAFKADKTVRSFGAEIKHVARSNDYMCSAIGGVERPKGKDVGDTDKDGLVSMLQASFDFCQKALAGVDDSKLSDPVPFFGGRKMARGAVMMSLAADWADHYSRLSLYLRMNGMLPPSARRGGM
ncbi:MAG: DinB family protein [Candidatus Palauibacterales bacterium]|nr:DinB family protein [Candidatus Palauibacterales bacterium]MDP2528723.1 DinB family protein [Candidatus Palauibacterales bacterium]MDP2585231.1 DinB family protein [Candidatus Palauibacterales bacterium]